MLVIKKNVMVWIGSHFWMLKSRIWYICIYSGAGSLLQTNTNPFPRFNYTARDCRYTISVTAMLLTIAFNNGFQYACAKDVILSGIGIPGAAFWTQQGQISRAKKTGRRITYNKNWYCATVFRQRKYKPIRGFATKYAIYQSPWKFWGCFAEGRWKNYDVASPMVFFCKSVVGCNFPDRGIGMKSIFLHTLCQSVETLHAHDKVIST